MVGALGEQGQRRTSCSATQSPEARVSRDTGQVGREWQLSRKQHQRPHQEHLAGAAS